MCIQDIFIEYTHGFFPRGQLFIFIPRCCEEARQMHNQPLRFLWPSWLLSNSKEWTIPPSEPRALTTPVLGGKKDTFESLLVVRGTVAIIQVNIYSFFLTILRNPK